MADVWARNKQTNTSTSTMPTNQYKHRSFLWLVHVATSNGQLLHYKHKQYNQCACCLLARPAPDVHAHGCPARPTARAGEATRIEAEIETRVCRHAPLPSSNMSPLMSQPGSRPRSTETDTLRRGGARCRALTRPASSRSSSWLEVCGGVRTGPRVQVAAGHSHLL